MKTKIDLKKLNKPRDVDELDSLFRQFEEEFHQCEEKLVEIRKNIQEFESQHKEDDVTEETAEDNKSTESSSV